eukprot:7425330-Pyramimonas_sp.AAC.1
MERHLEVCSLSSGSPCDRESPASRAMCGLFQVACCRAASAGPPRGGLQQLRRLGLVHLPALQVLLIRGLSQRPWRKMRFPAVACC